MAGCKLDSMVSLPRVELILKPTPLHRLGRLSERLGVDLWIKRDDLTGFALGGNKGRKLEYLIADVLASGADTVVACGAAQSNFIRQLGAACVMFGLECVAATMHLPYYSGAGSPKGTALAQDGGNLAIDALLGIEVRLFPDGDWRALYAHQDEVARELEAAGKRVYKVAIGGSSVASAYAFHEAGLETTGQAGPFDFLVTPSSSGSTHAGLAHVFAGTGTRVIGISADPDPDDELRADIVELCGGLDELTGLGKSLSLDQIDLRMDWTGEAYSIPSPEGNEAIRTLARAEGILLDPVYSGKAFAGLLELCRRGEIRGRVLFWHTGGIPTLFATNLA